MKAIGMLVAVLLLVRCAVVAPSASVEDQEARDLAAQAAPGKFQIAYAYRRSLQLYPCKCSIAPLGGMHREANALAKLRREGANAGPLLVLTNGTAFTEDSVEHEGLSAGALADLRATMIEGMNRLGVDAFGVGMEDLKLGEAALAKLVGKATFPVLALNAKSKEGKVKLVPFIEKMINGQFVLITSVVPQAAAALAPEFVVTEPMTALREFLAKPRKPGTLVIVLGDEIRDDREKALAQFPQLNFWLGSSRYELGRLVKTQYDQSTIALSPDAQVRSMGRIVVEPTKVKAQSDPVLTEAEQVQALKELLQVKGPAAPQGETRARIARVVATPKTATHLVKLEFVTVGDEFNEPRTPLHDIVDKAMNQAGRGTSSGH